jgi:hypothetical protein
MIIVLKMIFIQLDILLPYLLVREETKGKFKMPHESIYPSL